MIWDELTRKAFEIACKAHAGQVDRGGVLFLHLPPAPCGGSDAKLNIGRCGPAPRCG